MNLRNFLASTLFLISLALPAQAAELIMVERKGCHYCIEWKADLGPVYPNTPEGKYAPLRIIDISQGAPDGVTFARKVIYTPTFVLVENNSEIGRIEGYPGEDFFWGLLNMMLKAKTDYLTTSG
ncbi:MAG: thioredoxin family protein [Thalassovita sp.]